MALNNLLTWRPKLEAESPVSEPEFLWTMCKGRWQIDCALQNCGRTGWSVLVLLDGQQFFRCHFRTWEDAVERAEDKYAELAHGGWTPIPLSAD
jgi:hypothetical protein